MAYEAARQAGDTDYTHLVDFEPYEPSYEAPASFIASPIFDGAEKIGVLVFQMPIDRINGIMTNNGKWSDVGLGDSGETYIIGKDLTVRNQSRFLVEDSENYFKAIEEAGTPLLTVERIRNIGTTIGLQRVETPGVEAALNGESGTAIFPDYRDVRVLSAYKPLNIADVNWAIMSEIDEAEAFGPIFALRNGLIVFLLAATAVIAVAALLFSRTITRPLKGLTAYAHELSSHDFNQDSAFEYSGSLAGIEERRDEIGDLAVAFEKMQGDLELSVANLVESTAANERMQSELNIGRDIQMSMLPLLFPAFPEHDEFSIHAQLLPAREVGGDWYDFFFIDENLICFCVGDVSGKGVPAALFMAVAKTLIKSRAADDRSTAGTITHLNHELSQENKNFMFATIFIGILDLRTGELLYTNAAHNPALVKNVDGAITRVDSRHGLVVGPMRGSTYMEEKLVLAKGDIFLLYTDGITEAMDPKQELFSEERLVTLFASEDNDSAEELVQDLIATVKEYEAGNEQADDITVLAIQYFGPASDE
jgi:sigma-B regulation protein RsbU (phosphoserine phosphatase)